MVNDASGYYSTPEKNEALREIRQEAEAEKNGWYMFKNNLSYSTGFPKAMRSPNPNWPGMLPGYSIVSLANFLRGWHYD